MIITGKNYIESATLASSSGKLGQDVDNLKIPQLSKNFVMTASGVVDISNIDQFIQCIIIDKGTCESVSAVITWADSSTSSINLSSSSTCFYHLFSSTPLKMSSLSLTFVGETVGVILQDPSVGYIFIGDYLQLPAINQNSVLYYQTTTQKTSSISGQQYTDAGYQVVATTFDFPRVPDSTESYLGVVVAGRKQILATWRETELQYEWLFPWEQSLADVPPIFGSVEGDGLSFDRVSGEGKYWHMALSFREVK